jgi:rod shape-determining protein MreC
MAFNKKKVRWSVFGILIVMGLYAGSMRVEDVRSSLNMLGSWFFSAGMEVQKTLLAPFHQWCKYGSSINSLHERIDRLQKERDTLWQEMVKREGIVTFGQDTEEIRAYAKRYEHEGDLLLAHCMVKECTPDQQVMIVDKGARHGVTTSMVAVYKNMLLGRVSDVQDWHSKITLITDRLCKISAYCVKTRAAGIVEGTNNADEIQLSYISHLSTVQEGDEVLSSGQGLIFPRGFALGTITHCELNGLYHKVLIKPCIDVAAIDFCYLMEKGAVSGVDVVGEIEKGLEDGSLSSADAALATESGDTRRAEAH